MNQSRRAVLGILASGAGCAGFQKTDPEPRLAGGTVFNGTEEPQEVALQIERDGTIVHWESYELAPSGEDGFGVRVERSWDTEPAPYSIAARQTDGEWFESDVEPQSEHNCVEFQLFAALDGTLSLLYRPPADQEMDYYCSPPASTDTTETA